MQLALAAGGAAAAGWGVSTGMFAANYFGMSTVGLGWALGSTVGSMLFAPDMPNTQGSRLSDKSVQGSGYGQFIPITYGSVRLAGNIIWSTDLVEVSHTEEAGGGGKGGPSGGSYTTYSYFANFAVMVCEGPLDGVRKIWADGKLIFDHSEENLGFTGMSSGIRFYGGDETQLPDPYIESVEGVGKVPAYRGYAYCVFENFALANYGNRIPNMTFEIVRGTEYVRDVVTITAQPCPASDLKLHAQDYGGRNAFDTKTNRVWDCGHDAGTPVGGYGHNWLACWDYKTGDLLYYNDYGQADYYTAFNPSFTVYVPDTNEVWLSTVYSTRTLQAFDADTGRLNTSQLDSASYWQQEMLYNPYQKHVIRFSSNLTTGFTVYDVVSSSTQQIDLSWVNAKPVIATGASLGLASIVACGRNHTFMGDYNSQAAWLLNNNDYGIDSVISHYWDNPSTVFYDPKRNRFVVCGANLVPLPVAAGFTVLDADTGATIHTVDVYGHIGTSDNECHFGYYHEIYDCYVIKVGGMPNCYWLRYDADTFELIFNSGDVFGSGGSTNGLPTSDTTHVAQNYADTTVLSFVPLEYTITQSKAILGDIVEQLSERAGIDPSEVDTSAMTEEVHGYAITKQSSVRSAIEPLMTAYFYDAVESE